MTSPKIPPVQIDNADEYQQKLLASFGPDQLLNLFTTLAQHSKLLKDWLPLGGRLLFGGTLSDRDREILILSTSALCNAHYEWGQHVAIARSAGLSDAEIHACAASRADTTLDGFARTLHLAASELINAHCLDDDTWEALRARYDDKQMIELTMLVGHYAMLAGLLNSIDVQPEGILPMIGEVS